MLEVFRPLDRRVLKAGLIGGVFGLLFPVAASLLILLMGDGEPWTRLLAAEHTSNALLLIIDIAPLVIGGTAAYVAWKLQSVESAAQRARTAFEHSQAAVSQFINTCPDAVLTTGPGGLITAWNPTAEKIFGYTAEEALGRPLSIIDPPEHSRGRRSQFSHLTRTTDGSSAEVECMAKGQRRFVAAVSAGVLQNAAGRPIGLCAIIRDITEKRRIAHQLREARDQAEIANRAKSRFLATMSHEIRTPMNGVVGMAEILLETPLTSEQRDFVETLRSSADQLLFVINDILDFSKLEAGKMTIAESEVDVRQLLHTAGAMFAQQLDAKAVTLAVTVAPDVPACVLGDYHRIKQVVTNLLSNAMKFTESGQIAVRARLNRQVHDEVVLAFEVEDSGIGLSLEDRHKLFAAFSQIDSSSTRRTGGTGLGLAICKQLVDLMKGEIGVESVVGRGSTFWFTIRTRAVKATAALVESQLAATEPADASTRVLLVDDNAINLKVATTLLRTMNCSIVLAGNGIEAVEACRTGRYDLILMDVHMPLLDGFGATKQIRALANGADVPIVAMTARASADDRDECLAAGMDDHIAKPFRKEELQTVLTRWNGRSSTKARGTSPGTHTILITPQPPAPTDAKPSERQPEAAAFDPRSLDYLLGVAGDGGANLVEEIVQDFLGEAPTACSVLMRHAVEGNADGVRQVAHRMRSSTGNIGAIEMGTLCRQLEEHARDQDLSHAIEWSEAVGAAFIRTRDALERYLAATRARGGAAAPGSEPLDPGAHSSGSAA